MITSAAAEEAVLRRSIDDLGQLPATERVKNIVEYLDLKRAADWIIEGAFKRIGLQFSDELLGLVVRSTKQVREFVDNSDVKVFVLADTSYGSCCVDIKTAQHAQCDAILHFGATCFTKTSSNSSETPPVLHCLPFDIFNSESFYRKLVAAFIDRDDNLIIIASSKVTRFIDSVLVENRSLYRLFAKPIDDGHEIECKYLHVCNRCVGRVVTDIGATCVLYVGHENDRIVSSLVIELSAKYFYLFDTETESFQCLMNSVDIQRRIMSRFYMIERARDARRVGIVCGTLSAKQSNATIAFLRDLCRNSGKHPYVFCVGKITPEKIANFAEIDIFVLISCYENMLYDSKDFYRPFISPFELEMACNAAREWTGCLLSDYTDILPPNGRNYLSFRAEQTDRVDVSLINNAARIVHVGDEEAVTCDDSGALIKVDQPVAIKGDSALCFALDNRSWRGLDLNLADAGVSVIKQGRIGTPKGYIAFEEDEKR